MTKFVTDIAKYVIFRTQKCNSLRLKVFVNSKKHQLL